MGEGRLARAHDLRRRAETHIASAGWLSARELLNDALALYREEGQASGEAACLRGLGDVARKLDEAEAAAGYYRQALAAAQRSADRAGEGEALYRQAELLRAAGDSAAASELLVVAARVLGEAGQRRAEAQCHGILGELAREAGAPADEVLALYRRAHGAQMETGDLRGAAVTLTFMANFLKESRPALAAETFVQAARIFEGLGLTHRAEPFLAAARRLDPEHAPPPVPRRPGPWDTEDD